MSRIIVKNLPKNINENDIKKHFSVKGDVTDVKIMKKENGKSRNFCFVGFRDENSAKNAVDYFNKTFLKTSKIDVEIAKVQGDPSLKKNKGKKNKFNNDDDNNNQNKETKDSKIKKILELSKITKNSSKFDQVLENKNKENNNNENEENNKENNNNNNNNNENEENNNNEKNLDPKRLYLRNLPFQITENDLQNTFEKFGTISDIHIPINHKTNESFGYAYITYETVESCVMALSKMDETFFMGRKLHIEIAEEKTKKINNNNNNNLNEKNNNKKLSSFKSEKILQLKQNYSNQENWNYLFLNQNAVIDSIASRLNIPKSELLNKENPDIAIQISAMETKIINETKEWLKNEGINLDILKGKRNCTRSNTIIFVKNISNKTNKETLEKYFERFGSLIRFLISPSNTLAICEYVNKKHALNAMKHLSYKEIDGLPLYLEFAPEGIINNNNINLKENINESNENNNESNENNNNIDLKKGKILFITNLSFSTTEKQLKHFFESKDYHINKVEIVKHKKDNKNVSSGFGFCEFKSEEDMLKAIKNLNNNLLGGHSIKLSIAKTKSENKNFLGKKRKNETELNDYEYNNKNIDNTKLLIKNVAFEANKDELRKLFKVYGNIKNLRLPLKLDGSHRGFCFVEFISHDEAQKAFKELQNTHFYGRKLVIEWAQINKSVDELREETLKKSNLIHVQTHRKLNKGKIIIKK